MKKEIDERLLNACIVSYKISDIAKKTGYSRGTIYKRLSDEKFKRALVKRKGEILRAATGQMQSHLEKNTETLQKIIDDENISPQIRLNAINIFLKAFQDFLEISDFSERLEKLEGALENEQK